MAEAVLLHFEQHDFFVDTTVHFGINSIDIIQELA
jgi:hypothetical protein